MCGRASLSASPDDLREIFELNEKPDLPARYNIAPTDPMAVARPPQDLLARIHDRMPVILAPDEYAKWLDAREADVEPLLAGHTDALTIYPVGAHVNKAGNEGPECIAPIGEPLTS